MTISKASKKRAEPAISLLLFACSKMEDPHVWAVKRGDRELGITNHFAYNEAEFLIKLCLDELPPEEDEYVLHAIHCAAYDVKHHARATMNTFWKSFEKAFAEATGKPRHVGTAYYLSDLRLQQGMSINCEVLGYPISVCPLAEVLASQEWPIWDRFESPIRASKRALRDFVPVKIEAEARDLNELMHKTNEAMELLRIAINMSHLTTPVLHMVGKPECLAVHKAPPLSLFVLDGHSIEGYNKSRFKYDFLKIEPIALKNAMYLLEPMRRKISDGDTAAIIREALFCAQRGMDAKDEEARFFGFWRALEILAMSHKEEDIIQNVSSLFPDRKEVQYRVAIYASLRHKMVHKAIMVAESGLGFAKLAELVALAIFNLRNRCADYPDVKKLRMYYQAMRTSQRHLRTQVGVLNKILKNQAANSKPQSGERKG